MPVARRCASLNVVRAVLQDATMVLVSFFVPFFVLTQFGFRTYTMLVKSLERKHA